MNFSRFCSGRWAWISLATLWAVTRIYPIAQAIPWTYWKVWEAKKLLEYRCAPPLIVFVSSESQPFCALGLGR